MTDPEDQFSHNISVRVYFEDTDAGGVVYHTSFLRFAERARTELLRSFGISHQSLKEKEGIIIAVRSCNAEYIKPAKLDDTLEITSESIIPEATGLRLSQTIRRGKEILVSIGVRLVCVNESGKPVRLPLRIREKFEIFQS